MSNMHAKLISCVNQYKISYLGNIYYTLSKCHIFAWIASPQRII